MKSKSKAFGVLCVIFGLFILCVCSLTLFAGAVNLCFQCYSHDDSGDSVAVYEYANLVPGQEYLMHVDAVRDGHVMEQFCEKFVPEEPDGFFEMDLNTSFDVDAFMQTGGYFEGWLCESGSVSVVAYDSGLLSAPVKDSP